MSTTEQFAVGDHVVTRYWDPDVPEGTAVVVTEVDVGPDGDVSWMTSDGARWTSDRDAVEHAAVSR